MTLAICVCEAIVFSATPTRAQQPEKWNAPFGGTFNANITVASDYSYAGISNTARGPALQMGLDYRIPDLLRDPPLWLYLSVWGSNTREPAGSGVEVDLVGGMKFRLFDRRLKVDLGYGLVWIYFASASFDWHGFAVLATWLMTLVIQRAEHRDTQAVHAKLDELLHSDNKARNALTRVDEDEPETIEKQRARMRAAD